MKKFLSIAVLVALFGSSIAPSFAAPCSAKCAGAMKVTVVSSASALR